MRINSIIKDQILPSKHFPVSQQWNGRKWYYQITRFFKQKLMG
jgi:hypothetical protein